MTNGAFLLGVRNQATDVTSLTNVTEGNGQDILNLISFMPNFGKRAIYAATYGPGRVIEAAGLRADAILGMAQAQPDVAPNNVLCGVRGQATRAQDTGVCGENNAPGGTGVSGFGGQTGVYGSSPAAIGVAGGSENGIGVHGLAYYGLGVNGVGQTGVSGHGSQIGVFGEIDAPLGGTGVSGRAQAGTGVYGVSPQGIGVQGFSTNNIGVYASGSISGLVATSTGGVAARFDGNVFIDGSLTVSGNKSAAVPHPDGSRRQLYVLESPESWFEDFGQALLQDGRAEVKIDPEFAALIRADDYQVFLTPYGDCNGLYVSDRKSIGFTVRELQKGTSTLGFGYRILARRKDIEAGRLERVELPELPTPPEPSDFARPPVFEPPIRPKPLPEPDLPAQE